MKFKELHAENFCTLGKVTVRLDGRGLVLIQGENRDAPQADSNGAGKSLLLDALCWCLWGTTVRGIEDDKVVSRFAKNNCYVRVTFEDAGNNYIVERFRKSKTHSKPNDLLFTVNGESSSKGHMNKTQEFINQALGIDFDTFSIMMPGAGVKAAELTDTKIKEYLEKIMQTEMLGSAHTLAKEEAKRLEHEISVVSTELVHLAKNLKNNQDLLDSYKIKSTTHQEEQDKEYQALLDKLDSISEKRASLVNVLGNEDAIKESCAKSQVRMNEVMNNINETTARIIEVNKTAQIRAVQYASGSQKIKSELDALSDKIIFLSDNDSCTQCDQHIHEDFKSEQEAELGKQINKLKADKAKLDAANKKAIQREEADTKTFKDMLANFQAEQASIAESQQKSMDLLSEFNKAKFQLNLLTTQMEDLTKEANAFKKKDNPFFDLISFTELEISTISKKINDLEEAKKILDSQLVDYKFWIDGFSTKGIRSYMLKHVTPILNSRAKYYADLLTAGEMVVKFHTERTLANGKNKEEFHIEVIHSHGSDSYEGSSVGERGRADLIISFTLGDLASLRANKIIPFRFLDEPFENIDASGNEAIIRLLNDQKDKYDTVFVITHKEAFKQLFQNKMLVVKQNGVSTLEIS